MHKDGYKPMVSIIVPVHNQSSKTVRCFASIRANTKTPHEIIWVDNGSTPQHFSVIKRQAIKPRMHTKLVKFKNNTGFVKATNIGIREVERSSKYIILLNNDTEVTMGWEQQLIRPLRDNPDAGAVGPVTQSKLSWQEASYLNAKWNLSLPAFPKRGMLSDKINAYGEILKNKYENQYQIVKDDKLSLSFFCVALRKKTFEKFGLLDESFGIGFGDDDEYCHRLRMNGLDLFISLGTFVYHWHRTTFNALNLPVDSLQRRNTKLLRAKNILAKKQ